jgi:hypothetical protein
VPRASLFILVSLSLLGSLHAQIPGTTGEPPVYLSDININVPIANAAKDRYVQLELYSAPVGSRNWVRSDTIAPDKGRFIFRAPGDGAYLLAVRGILPGGIGQPQNLSDLRPMKTVVIDTIRPQVTLRQLTAQPGTFALGWEIRDENLDLSTFRLEYRWPDQSGSSWQLLPTDFAPGELQAVGSHAWNLPTRERVEVRLTVRDRAGNLGERVLMLAPPGIPGEAGGQSKSLVPQQTGRGGVLIKNKREFTLNCDIVDVGPSRLATVELYWTKDKQTWKKYPETGPANGGLVGELPTRPDKVEVSEGTERRKLPFKADADGLYGFRIVARSGAGRGEPPPKAGDEPTAWVLIDTTPPLATLTKVVPGNAEGNRSLHLQWTASDENLRPDPITLQYSLDGKTDWQPIAVNLPHKSGQQGNYTWMISNPSLCRFHVRLVVEDLAGNTTEDVWAEPVIVDPSVPRVRNIVIDP